MPRQGAGDSSHPVRFTLARSAPILIALAAIAGAGRPARAALNLSGLGDFDVAFNYGFASGGATYTSTPVTPATVGSTRNYTYTDTAISDSIPGVSATATINMTLVTSGNTVGFTNIVVGLSQTNPTGIALQPATLAIAQGFSVGTNVDGTHPLAIVTLPVTGNVGPSTGDYSSANVNLDADISAGSSEFGNYFLYSGSINNSSNVPLQSFTGSLGDVTYTDSTPGTAFANQLNVSGQLTHISQTASEYEVLDMNFAVLDPGGTGSMNATGSSTSSVPEPGSLSLLGLVGVGLLRRHRRGRTGRPVAAPDGSAPG